MPDDPLTRSFDRTIAWSGREPVLFAHEIVPQPGAREPSLVIAAALELDTGDWRRLPDPEILGQGARWFEHDGQLIQPALGSADGGEVGNWGRPFPYGGMLDPQTGQWSDLPGSPADLDLGSGEDFAGGILAGDEADYFGYGGWILDVAAGEWIEIPALDDEDALITGAHGCHLGPADAGLRRRSLGRPGPARRALERSLDLVPARLTARGSIADGGDRGDVSGSPDPSLDLRIGRCAPPRAWLTACGGTAARGSVYPGRSA